MTNDKKNTLAGYDWKKGEIFYMAEPDEDFYTFIKLVMEDLHKRKLVYGEAYYKGTTFEVSVLSRIEDIEARIKPSLRK